MTRFISKFLRDENGATAIEYGLIAAVMATAVLAAFQFLGDSINTMFTGVVDQLTAAQNPT